VIHNNFDPITETYKDIIIIIVYYARRQQHTIRYKVELINAKTKKKLFKKIKSESMLKSILKRSITPTQTPLTLQIPSVQPA